MKGMAEAKGTAKKGKQPKAWPKMKGMAEIKGTAKKGKIQRHGQK